MKTNIPVGSIILIKEKINFLTAVQRIDLLYNFAIQKFFNAEYISTALTDIDDEGNLCILEVTNEGVIKTKYENWESSNKEIAIYTLNLEHSKEKLYLFTDWTLKTKYSKFESFQIHLWNLLYYTLLFISHKTIIDLSSLIKLRILTNHQYPMYVWESLTKLYPFWREFTTESLKNLLSLNGELLFKGNSNEL